MQASTYSRDTRAGTLCLPKEEGCKCRTRNTMHNLHRTETSKQQTSGILSARRQLESVSVSVSLSLSVAAAVSVSLLFRPCQQEQSSKGKCHKQRRLRDAEPGEFALTITVRKGVACLQNVRVPARMLQDAPESCKQLAFTFCYLLR